MFMLSVKSRNFRVLIPVPQPSYGANTLLGQRIYFYLNHPIRYVRVVGVVVAIDDINVKYTVLTLDDGSGATIECKIVRLAAEFYNSVESASNTMIENVNVISHLGIFEVTVDHEHIDIGTVIKAKGTISEFRGKKQLELKRVWLVRTTNEEVKAWAETAAYKREVLSVPWHISSAGHKKIKNDIKVEKKKTQEYEKLKAKQEQLRAEHEAKRLEHRKARQEYLAKHEAKLEARRPKEEAMMNAGALV
jgi:hypothetical protein